MIGVVDKEKKDLEGERKCCVDNMGKGDKETEEKEEEEEELTDLPEELSVLIEYRVFCSSVELQSFLNEVSFGDLKVVLVNGVPHQVMPLDQHNGFTMQYLLYLSHKWAKNRWGCASTTHKICIQNGGARKPDFSYWGYPRCRFNKGTLVPKKDGLIPDVVIQFSWRNVFFGRWINTTNIDRVCDFLHEVTCNKGQVIIMVVYF